MLFMVTSLLGLGLGFGGGKSTVFIPCNSDNNGSKTLVLQKTITDLFPVDSLILNATCAFSSLQLQSYTNIIVDINGGSPGYSDVKALSQL